MKPACAEIQQDAAGLASLRGDDPDRRAAFAHAERCPGCAAALAEARAMLAALDLALEGEAARPESLARVRRLLLEEAAQDPVARAIPARAASLLVASVTAALLAEWAVLTAKHWTNGRGLVASLALALAAAASSVFALRFGRIASAVAVPALSIGSAVLGGGSAGLEAELGVKCALEVAAATALLLVPALIAARRGLVPRPETIGPAIGAAAALNGQAALVVSCHAEPSTWHPLFFHSAPVLLMGAVCLLAAKLSFGIGRRLRAR